MPDGFQDSPICRPQNCTNCPYKSRTVGPRGRFDAPVVIVGEGPGIQEVKEGKPFSGPSGTVLWSCFPEGIDFEKRAFVTNAMNCAPVNKTISNLGIGTKACSERLKEEITAHPRKLIIALGNAALWSLTGDYDYKITQVRGGLIPSPLAELGILPLVHPAALLRGTGSYRQFKEDILYGLALADDTDYRKHVLPEIIHIAETEEQVQQFLKELKSKYKYIAADTETSGFNPRVDYPLCMTFCGDPNEVYVIPGDWLSKCKEFMEDPELKFIWHNGKFDVQWYWEEGVQARVDEDTLLLSYAQDETGGVHDLEQVAGDVLHAPDYKHMLKPYLTSKKVSYAVIPKPVLYKYAAIDTSLTLQIWQVYRPRVKADRDLEKLYTRVLIPISELLGRAEQKGLLVDIDWINKIGDDYVGDFNSYLKTGDFVVGEAGGLIGTALEKFKVVAGDVNPASPKQVAELLYDKLKLPKLMGRGTGKDILKKLPQVPAVIHLQEIRKHTKAFSTYVTGMLNAREADGRIHTTYLIHGTRTGRPSSRKPNVLNIPRLAKVRGMFIAPKNYVLLEVDLNQAELRSLAALSGDEFLCGIYNSEHESLHDEMSRFLFGTNFTPEDKMRAKAVNFGIPYGREAFSIGFEFDVKPSVAQKWIDGWFQRAPGAHKFILRCRRAASTGSTITTCFGRKKRHWIVTQESLKALQNEASNFPHQSIAADIVFTSGIAVTRAEYVHAAQSIIKPYDAHIVNMIYDSLVVEVFNDPMAINETAKLIKNTMMQMPKNWGITKVPFVADAKVGTRWGFLESLKTF